MVGHCLPRGDQNTNLSESAAAMTAFRKQRRKQGCTIAQTALAPTGDLKQGQDSQNGRIILMTLHTTHLGNYARKKAMVNTHTPPFLAPPKDAPLQRASQFWAMFPSPRRTHPNHWNRRCSAEDTLRSVEEPARRLLQSWRPH